MLDLFIHNLFNMKIAGVGNLVFILLMHISAAIIIFASGPAIGNFVVLLLTYFGCIFYAFDVILSAGLLTIPLQLLAVMNA